MNAVVRKPAFAANKFRESWIAFLRVEARNSKVKFAVGNPATDGKTVYLPPLPAELTPDDMVVFKRFGHHEIGHVLWSNLAFYQAFGKEHGKNPQFMLNALDDVWMEEKRASTSRTAGRYFREGIAIMTRKKVFRDGSNSAFEAIACYCRTALGARKWSEFAESCSVSRGNVHKHFGEHAPQILENLDEILFREFPNVRSTEDAGALTLRIIEMLKSQSPQQDEKPKDDEEQEPKDESEEPQGQDDSNGGDSDDSEQSTPDQSDESEDTGSSNAGGGDEEKDESDDGDSAGDSGDSGTDETEETDDEDNQASNGDGSDESQDSEEGEGADQSNGQPSLEEIIKKMFEEEVEEGEVFDDRKYIEALSEAVENGDHPDYEGVVNVPSFDVDGDPISEQVSRGAGKGDLIEGMPVCPANPAKARELSSNLDRKFRVLAAKLQSLLQDREEAEVYSSIRGRLDETGLYRFASGDMRVHEQTVEVERTVAAVSLVADLSGSTMFVRSIDLLPPATTKEEQAKRDEERRKKLAFNNIQQSLLVMENMLEQLGNPREIIGFAPKGGELSTIVRTFADDRQTAVSRIGGLSDVVGGYSTPIGEAVFQASQRLLAHESNRKVMFVLTDGAPSDVELAKQQTISAITQGISVVYLVIGEDVEFDWLAEIKCPFVHAKTAEDLCPLLLEQAKELID
jgi:hypothetical protein